MTIVTAVKIDSIYEVNTFFQSSMYWTSAGSVVDSYEVMWQRDTSGDCPDEDDFDFSRR